jgi:hypothetical protein
MKPDCPVARRNDYAIHDCPHDVASRFVAQHHYARGASNTGVYSHGLVRVADGQLVGVAMWLPPTRVAAESVAGEAWRGVLALSRLAVAESEPQNATTILLGASMRRVMRDDRWHTLLTYADTRQGHTGAIYRATNWTHVEVRKGDPCWVDPKTGRQVARKSAGASRTAAQMEQLGYERLAPVPKHKFVFSARRVTP